MKPVVVVVVVGIYKRWLHVQLAVQREGPRARILPQNKHRTKERGQKCGRVAEARGGGEHGAKVVGIELRWRHGMGNKTNEDILIIKKRG